MAQSQMKITLDAPKGCGKTTLAKAIESFVRANWPAKSIARFQDVDYDPTLVYSNCDIVIIEKVAKG